ncbi:MAG: hypothetical protein HOI23_08180 [Deltaproteobacteria bacterium]|jgi:hypothetical protein|nr:hypothetical protein [Deltaproteobacteria bacterium]MBT6433306.1 hypothetical protein [Deltaproteobacteria bacterium]
MMMANRFSCLLAAFLVLSLCACSSLIEEPESVQVPTDLSDGEESTEIEETNEPSEFEITGVVVDDDQVPVADAMVMQGGRAEAMVLTEEDGTFTLPMVNPGYGIVTVVASKLGFRATGLEFMSDGLDVTLTIRELKGPDNEEYIFEEPGDGIEDMREDCSHCHTKFVSEFLSSKHAEAGKNPLLHDIYAGVNRSMVNQVDCEAAGGSWLQGKEPGTDSTLMMRCYLGGGVLSDLNMSCGGPGELSCDDPGLSAENKPSAFGACADCHAPGINGQLGDRDLGDAVGLAYEKGVHCDVCHKVADIDMSKPPGVGKRLVMGRPSEPGRNTFVWDPVYYGPLPDVPNVAMGGSYQPKFNQAVFCAGCHEQNQAALIPGEELAADKFPDGLPIHTTYSEWQAGPYNSEATPCQFCHMPETHGATNATNLATRENQSATFGFERDPSDVRSHIFRGPLQGEERLIDEALYVSVKLEEAPGVVEASVSVANVGCGHAVPTGEPMRALVMVVEADGDNCAELTAIGGMTVQEAGGTYLKGVVGQGVSFEQTAVSWPAAGEAMAGMVVRAVRPTGVFDDYAATGYFARSTMSAQDKGLEIMAPIGSATVVVAENGSLTLDRVLALQAADVVYLGDGWTGEEIDGASSKPLAGLAGYTFAKVLTDSSGNLQVPHYKAVDMLRDNRIGPGARAITHHSFEVPAGCETGTIRARVLYRPIPVAQAALRGWTARDYIIASGSARFGEEQTAEE